VEEVVSDDEGTLDGAEKSNLVKSSDTSLFLIRSGRSIMRSSRACRVLHQAAQWVLLVGLLSVSAQAQKIKVEFDKNLDFAKFKTFAWGKHDAVSRPTLVLAIAGAIQEELTKRGLQRTDSNPDLYIQMYGSVDSDMSVSYSDPLYIGTGGIPPFDQSFPMWGAVPGATTTVVVHKGQLVVDLIDATEKKLTWRGMATEKLSDKKMKLINQINTAVEKMFQQYPVGKK
jgi:hypothetical protein